PPRASRFARGTRAACGAICTPKEAVGKVSPCPAGVPVAMRVGQRGGRLAGSYEGAAPIWEAGGDALTPAALGAPKIRTPTPISKSTVSSATETRAKL